MSTATVDILFRPFEFGNRTLRNRIVMGPMTRQRSPGGIPGPDVAAYYKRRAIGGVGLIITEGTYIDHPAASAQQNVPFFFGDAALEGWRAVLRGSHEAGAAIIPQLWHTGAIRRLGTAPDPSVPGYGPAMIDQDGVEVVRAARDSDLAEIAASYGRGARSAEALGFDGVAIHGAHGYLLDQFLWTRTNTRVDAYGGSLHQRLRFPVEVVRSMRSNVQSNFPIVFRFSQWKMDDYDAKIAESPSDLETIVTTLADAGVDLFDVSSRRFWVPAFKGSPLSLAAWTRKLANRPVIAVGSVGLDQPHQSKVYRRPDNIEAKVTDIDTVLERMVAGDFDLVAVARALLADPNWAEKIRTGALDQIEAYTIDASRRYY